MLNHLRIQNFKSWEDTGEIRLAPLTGLFGVNSSGKSAILQLLLLLKQTVESSDPSSVLNLGSPGGAGPYVNFGSMHDVLHNHEMYDRLTGDLKRLTIDFNWTLLEPILIPDPEMGPSKAFLNIERACFQTSIMNDEWESSSYDDSEPSFYKQWGPAVERFEYRLQAGNRNYEFGMQEKARNEYAFVAGGFEVEQNQEFIKSDLMKFYGFPDHVHHYIPNIDLRVLMDAFENQLRHIFYLGPLREPPRMVYELSGEEPPDVGSSGEESVSALLAAQRKGKPVREHVSKGLRELELADSLDVKPFAETKTDYEVRVRQSHDSRDVRLTDVGFGVSQVLPVLTLCYYAPEGSTLILEHPEMHLHPKAQAGLADVFIDAITNRNIQIILESHSEHLLHRLQRRIAEERIDSESCALYFIENPDGRSTIRELELTPFGNITNWPQNFFGDDLGDLVALTKASIRREKGQR